MATFPQPGNASNHCSAPSPAMWPNNSDNHATFCPREREVKNPGASPGGRSTFKPGTDFRAAGVAALPNHSLIEKHTKRRKKTKERNGVKDNLFYFKYSKAF